MEIKKEQTEYWDNLKGLLILLVVFGSYTECIIPTRPGFTWVWTAVYSFHMQAFVLVIGYFLGKSTKDPVEKIPKMMGLYLLTKLAYAVRPLLYGKGIHIEMGSPQYGCWILLFLAYGYVLAHFLKRGKNYLIFAGTVIAALLAGFDVSIGKEWALGQSFYFMPFLIGAACFDLEKAVEWSKKHIRLTVAGFFLIQLALILARNASWFNRKIFRGIETYKELYSSSLRGALGRSAGYLITFVLIICLLGLIPRKKTMLAMFGRHTLVIYLVHTFMIKNVLPELQEFPELSGPIRLLILTILIILVCGTLVAAHELFWPSSPDNYSYMQ